MDEADVDAALIHPPGWDPDSELHFPPLKRPKKISRPFRGHGPVSARSRPEESQAGPRLAQRQPGMMGLRWPLLSEEQQKWLVWTARWDRLWPEVEREGLPVAMMGGLFLPKFREIAERHPHLRMILDHCGLNRHSCRTPRPTPPSRRAGEALIRAAQRRRQGDRRTALFDGALPISQYPGRTATHLRRLRTEAHVLGYGYHPHALQLPSMRHVFYGRTALAEKAATQAGRDGPQPPANGSAGIASSSGRPRRSAAMTTAFPPVSIRRQAPGTGCWPPAIWSTAPASTCSRR